MRFCRNKRRCTCMIEADNISSFARYANLIWYFSSAGIFTTMFMKPRVFSTCRKFQSRLTQPFLVSCNINFFFPQISTCVFVYSLANIRRLWSSHEHWLFNNDKHAYDKIDNAIGTSIKLTVCSIPVRLKSILWVDLNSGLVTLELSKASFLRQLHDRVSWC